jgi:Lon protease-like protein
VTEPITIPDQSYDLPLFPLNAVLFPGGVLPLRIFEARYMDMVRACMRDEREFGICLIRKGPEVGAGAQPESIGCRAGITDFNMEQLGVLQISTIGTQRFRVLDTREEKDGLLLARTEPLESETESTIPAKFKACADLLQRIIQQLDREIDRIDADNKLPIVGPYRLNDASWVGNRLCEVLPISLVAKQKLMELTDAPTRLSIVHQYLLQQKII